MGLRGPQALIGRSFVRDFRIVTVVNSSPSSLTLFDVISGRSREYPISECALEREVVGEFNGLV